MTTLFDASASSRPGWLPAGLRPLGPVLDSACGFRLRAVDTSDDTVVFVKRFRDSEAADRVGSLLRKLNGAAVARLRNKESGLLVFEHLDGETLEQLLKRSRGRLPAEVLRPLLTAAAAAVQSVHMAGVLHRDLKPSHILLRPDGGVTLLDFDAAMALDETAGGHPMTLLTPGYAAPEQYRQGGPEGPWTDVYALAAIAYRALTGAPPPPAPLRAAGGSDLDDLGETVAMPGILHQALALDPRKRIQNAADFRRALSASGNGSVAGTPISGDPASDEGPPTVPVVREPGAAVPPPRNPDLPTAQRSRRRRVGRLLLVLLLALATLAVIADRLGRPWYEQHVKRDWVIDAGGAGDSDSIANALARAGDGAVLRIRPGTYAESLLVVRPMTLAAADPDNPPVIAPLVGPCLTLRGDGVVVLALDLRAPPMTEGAEAQPCVVIGSGAPQIEGNRISGIGAPALLLRDGTTATVVGNTIHSSVAGIVVTAGATPGIERNTLADIAGPALVVRGGAAPSVEDNIFEASGAVVFGEGASGSFRGNTLREGRGTAIEISGAANPEITGNSIVRPAQSGVYVYGDGRGRVHDNSIEASKLSGIVVEGGTPQLNANQITESGEHGILIVETSGGEIEGNTVRNSRRNGIVVGADARIRLSSNILQGNAAPQLIDLRRDEAAAAGGVRK